MRCRSVAPARRISRSRRSARCSRMKTATTKTMPAVVNGCTAGVSTCRTISMGVASGCRISTRIGWSLLHCIGRAGTAFRRGRAASSPNLRPASSSKAESRPSVTSRTDSIFRSTVAAYRGASAASPANCVPISAPTSTTALEREQRGEQHRQDPAEPQPPQQGGDRRQEEGQQDRERDGDQHLLSDIQGRRRWQCSPPRRAGRAGRASRPR